MRNNTDLAPTQGLELAPFGVLSPAVTVYDETDDFWSAGITYEGYDSGVVVNNVSIQGVSPAVQAEVGNNSADKKLYKFYYPFAIQSNIKVSTFGLKPDEIENRLKKTIDVITQKAVEKELWDGDISKQITSSNDNRYLASSSSIDVTPTAGTGVKVNYGLLLLEEAISNDVTGAKGVILAPKGVASVLRAVRNDDVLETQAGTPIVAGVGFSDKGPDGTSAGAGKAWMYATGPITVRLGPVVITPGEANQAVDIGVNTVQYYVDRSAAVTWGTSHSYAVLVDLTLDYA